MDREYDLFLPDNEYNRYIIVKFDFEKNLENILYEYSQICIDSPKISDYYIFNKWAIIPCQTNLINRGCFFDLMSYIKSYVDCFAIGLNENNTYFSVVDPLNPYKDTVIVKFDSGDILLWDLPLGLCNDTAYDLIGDKEIIPQNSCKEFLISYGADDLIEHFNL